MENDLIIPIVSIVGGILLGGFFWWNLIRAQVRARELLHAERQAAIEKGLPPPDEPSQPQPVGDGGKVSPPAKPATNALGTGLFWLFLGLGVMIAMRIVYPEGTNWGWGVIPVALGLAYLVGFGLSYWPASRGGPDTPGGDADTR
jgi:hypothetical protein